MKMRESDIKDKQGNIVISPGLKVVHKDSGFEYTVDSVLQEPNGQVTVMLASPETPRVEPTGGESIISDKHGENVIYEAEPVQDLSSNFYLPDEDDVSDEDLLAVPAKEFEKEYVVR